MNGAERQELVVLTRQWATLIESSSPIDVALEVLKEQCQSPRVRDGFDNLLKRIISGSSLARAAAETPEVFHPFYVAMLKVGETSGRLDIALERLSGYLERDHHVKKKLQGALTYPAFIFCLTLLLTGIVFTTVLPGFVEMFRELGAELPLMTRILIALTDAVSSPATWLVVVALVLEGWVVVRAIRRSPEKTARVWEVLLRLPVLGSLLVRASVARFAASMHTLLVCGITLDRALRTASSAGDNPLLEQAVLRGVEDLKAGFPFSGRVAEEDLVFPQMAAQMVKLGEDTASMEEVFLRISTFYEQELDYKIEGLTKALEPMLLAFVAFVVGFIVISIFLPLYGMLNNFA